MHNANGMTPQQVRLFHLQASRAWGNFTRQESDTLHSEAPKKRREASRPDLSPYIRLEPAGIDLNSLKTLLMPGE